MAGWMDGQIDSWADGLRDGWVDQWVDREKTEVRESRGEAIVSRGS